MRKVQRTKSSEDKNSDVSSEQLVRILIRDYRPTIVIHRIDSPERHSNEETRRHVTRPVHTCCAHTRGYHTSSEQKWTQPRSKQWRTRARARARALTPVRVLASASTATRENAARERRRKRSARTIVRRVPVDSRDSRRRPRSGTRAPYRGEELLRAQARTPVAWAVPRGQ